jgi:nucleoid DNA-binding protein
MQDSNQDNVTENPESQTQVPATTTGEPTMEIKERPYLNKEDIIKTIAGTEELVIKDVKKVVDSFLITLKEYISLGKPIRIQGLGTFQIKVRKPRKARNPVTGETFMTQEKRVLVFKLSRELRRVVEPTLR